MKVPPDALVEWRCNCGKLAGYIRQRDGQFVYSTQVWTGRELVPTYDEQLPERAPLTLCCGRHYSRVDEARLPRGPARTKVIVQPDETVSRRRFKEAPQQSEDIELIDPGPHLTSREW